MTKPVMQHTPAMAEILRAREEERKRQLRPAVADTPVDGDVRRLALSRLPADDLEPVYDTTGFETEITKRANVFRSLSIGKSPVLTNNQAVYGQHLVEIYAAWKGADGPPEMDGLRVRVSASAPDPSNDRRLIASDLYHRIMVFVGPTSARLLTALCDDWVLGDGRDIERDKEGKPVPRWRSIVKRVCGESETDRQSVYIKIACRDLETWFSRVRGAM